ncbi:unnamed protein product [Camellia sinensis]
MEDYLLYMKTLRSQMNDVEDQATKISVEEQMQITTIQTLQKDLDLAHSDIKQLKEETDQMVKAEGQICAQILEKQRKIAYMESDSSTLSQTLELIQQERVSLSAKFVEKSTYYTKVFENINAKLQEQQDWMNSYKLSSTVGQHGLVIFSNTLSLSLCLCACVCACVLLSCDNICTHISGFYLDSVSQIYSMTSHR